MKKEAPIPSSPRPEWLLSKPLLWCSRSQAVFRSHPRTKMNFKAQVAEISVPPFSFSVSPWQCFVWVAAEPPDMQRDRWANGQGSKWRPEQGAGAGGGFQRHHFSLQRGARRTGGSTCGARRPRSPNAPRAGRELPGRRGLLRPLAAVLNPASHVGAGWRPPRPARPGPARGPAASQVSRARRRALPSWFGRPACFCIVHKGVTARKYFGQKPICITLHHVGVEYW